jgi:hypothetical protein
MAFSSVTRLILEPFGCSILKLTKSWRLARLPSARQNHVVSLFLSVEVMRNLTRRSYDEDGGMAPAVAHVPTTLTMIKNAPSPTPTMTSPDQGEDVVEGG